ncbi:MULTISPECIES: sulfatase-like hydrolase/transferase [unclassified Lentimonas]|uniref:sulfatase-like hydrolase/transferase n=1 Tax=unclassified Lentimonas TaxID=2630993 RepID=UPI0013250BF0|nr:MULTISPECIES: sulfatase-like hydrolase/transferase [unclassified Lentimonas]CAA6690708.1 Unannotated [Lentimonas sp. CC19]CAA6693350.1 Unannotated [Lentimonas sp. CC10]CAA7071828.1 Unannotated [Lentimonas sp. CC11]
MITKIHLLFIASLVASSAVHSATVYEDDFTGATLNDAVWNVDANDPVTFDAANDQLDYSHAAGTARRFVSDGTTLVGKTGYIKADISNFAGDASIWFGFVGDSPGNNTNYAYTTIAGNGTYEVFFNNTASSQSFSNGAGWSGTLDSGTGLWRVNGGTATAITVGAGVSVNTDVSGFGFANFSNSNSFPDSSFSVDSFLADDSLTIGSVGNIAPTTTITTPADGSSVVFGTNVNFTGTASDFEDGDLTTSLAWTSDLDGSLGTGASVNTTTLQMGAHTITASVTDSGSQAGTSSIALTVTSPPVGNVDPQFITDPIVKLPAVIGVRYAGSIIADATDANGDALTFAIDNGPAWLTMASNGHFSGTPDSAGLKEWDVSVADGNGGSDTAILQIQVDATGGGYTGQPNVIVIISDDAGYADFSFMNGLSGKDSEVPTPHLDTLASRGVTFSRAYVAANCQPTRTALATGAYQQRIGNESVGNDLFLVSQGEEADNNLEGVYEGIPVEVDTIWDRMKTLGYTTCAIGKWHLGQTEDLAAEVDPEYPLGRLGNRPQNQGIDEFYGMWHGSRDFTVGTYNENQVDNPESALQPRYIREAFSYPDGSTSETVVEYSKFANVPSAPKYITNIFGDYAEQFVEDHYDDAEPFFLYVGHPAPHKPWTNESPDFNDPRIADWPDQIDSEDGMVDNSRKQVASMMITMDKEIGELMAKLEDPNSDGDTSDSIVDKTLVIFINDNGGVVGQTTLPDGVTKINGTDNGKLKGFKGSSFDGGIRVPMILAGAGLDPSKRGTVFYDPVHGVDILATAYELGGGAPLDRMVDNVDGVNLLPYINGTNAGNPHEVLVHKWRGSFSVIRGDYTLQNSRNILADPQWYDLFQMTDSTGGGAAVDVDPGQETELSGGAYDLLIEQLKRDLTDQEAIFDKPRYAIRSNTIDTEPINVFDHHVFRSGIATNWSGGVDPAEGTGGSRNWYKNGTTVEKYLFNTDCFPGAVLEFPVHTSDYTANNDYRRKTGMEFMLNKIILSGDFDSGSNQSATIQGNEILFTNNLQGVAPQIALDATNVGAGDFSYDLDLDVKLYHDLKLTGDGDAVLNINGVVGEYEAGFYTPRGVIKEGTCTVNLTAVNTYTGDTTVNAGTLSLAEVNTSNDASAVRLATSGATLDLAYAGTDTVDALFIGGVQQAAGVYGAAELSQITGTGTLTVTSGPATYSMWAAENAPGQTIDQDHDFDGVANGIEYFMGESGSGFTALPSPDNTGTVTWPMGHSYAGVYATDYVIQSSSPDLDSWGPIALQDVTILAGASVSYAMPPGSDPFFVRLLVYEN